MNAGAALVFDPETEAAIRKLWQELADAGLPSHMLSVEYPPHMTLLMAESLDVRLACRKLKPFAEVTPPLPVHFLSLGLFPAQYGVVYLAPVVDRDLLALYETLWQTIRPLLESPAGHYQPGVWVPHVTLAFNLPPAHLGAAADFLARSTWPEKGLVTGVILGDFALSEGSQYELVSFTGKPTQAPAG